MTPVTWSANQRQDHGTVWLDLAGDLRGLAAEQLRATLVQTIATRQPDRLLVGLDAVSDIDLAAVTALMSGYLTAIDCGTSYHVTGAHDRVRQVLQDAGTLDILADSDDLGALMLALLRQPSTHGPAADH